MPTIVTVFVPLILLAVLCAACYAWGCETGYWQAIEDYGIEIEVDNETT